MAQSTGSQLPVIGIVSRIDHSVAWTGYELYGQGAVYIRSVALAGGAPVIIPLELGEAGWKSIYERVDGLLFPGGEDVDPAHYGETPRPRLGQVSAPLDEAELTLARWALEDGFPTLGVCRGIQLLNVAAGGTLYQDLPTEFPDVAPHACSPPAYPREYRAHMVRMEPGSLVAEAMGTTECRANSRHHQAIKDLAPGFRITARADDGVIEAVEYAGAPFILGVQWHPESLAEEDPQMLGLFAALVRAAAARPTAT